MGYLLYSAVAINYGAMSMEEGLTLCKRLLLIPNSVLFENGFSVNVLCRILTQNVKIKIGILDPSALIAIMCAFTVWCSFSFAQKPYFKKDSLLQVGTC